MIRWLDTLPVLLATLAVFFLPGILVGFAAGVRRFAVIALAPAISLGVAGVGAIFLSVIGLGWSLGSYLAFTAVVALAVLALARFPLPFLGKGVGSETMSSTAVVPTGPNQSSLALARWLSPVSGVAIAAFVSFTPLKEGMRRPDYPALTWDSVHHHSSVRYILDTGNGSSLNLGAVASTDGAARFYPGAWHDLVSLTVGTLPISVSINVAALVMACLIWPTTVAYLAQVAFPRLLWMPLIAPVIASGFVAFPARMMSYGTVWPSAMGTAILPSLIAVVLIFTSSRIARVDRFRWIVVLLISLAGASLCHPTATIAAAYLCLPFLLYRYGRVVRRKITTGRRSVVLLSVLVPVLAMSIIVVAIVSVPNIRSVFYFQTTPVGPATTAVGAAMFDTMLAPLGHGNLQPFWVGGLLAVAGFILTFVLREARWVSLSWIICVLLYVIAAGEQTFLRPLVGLWYSDPVRLGGLVPLFTSLLSAFALTRCIQLLVAAISTRVSSLTRPPIAAAAGLSLLILSSAVLYPQTVGLNAEERSERLAADYWRHLEWSGGIASLSELQMIDRLESKLPEDAVVLGDPTSGAALVYSLADRAVVFPTMAGAWSEDAEYLGRNFDRLDTDPRVCDLIRQFDVSYFYDDDGRYLPDIIHRRNMGGLTEVGLAPEDLSLVDSSDDGAAIYKIEACGL